MLSCIRFPCIVPRYPAIRSSRRSSTSIEVRCEGSERSILALSVWLHSPSLFVSVLSLVPLQSRSPLTSTCRDTSQLRIRSIDALQALHSSFAAASTCSTRPCFLRLLQLWPTARGISSTSPSSDRASLVSTQLTVRRLHSLESITRSSRVGRRLAERKCHLKVSSTHQR